MACRRCSVCAINYPATVAVCRACGDTTSYLSDIDPDQGWEDAATLLLVDRPSASEQQLRDWRHHTLERLGFGGALLDLLVERPTDLHLADTLVAAGCPLPTAARILL